MHQTRLYHAQRIAAAGCAEQAQNARESPKTRTSRETRGPTACTSSPLGSPPNDTAVGVCITWIFVVTLLENHAHSLMERWRKIQSSSVFGACRLGFLHDETQDRYQGSRSCASIGAAARALVAEFARHPTLFGAVAGAGSYSPTGVVRHARGPAARPRFHERCSACF